MKLTFAHLLLLCSTGLVSQPAFAQQLPPSLPDEIDPTRTLTPTPTQEFPQKVQPAEPVELPAIEDLNLPPSLIEIPTEGVNQTIKVERYEVRGSTLFSREELERVTQEFTGENVSLARMNEAAAAVTKFYQAKGYVTTGAYVPAGGDITAGVVPIQVVEGGLEGGGETTAIRVRGTRRLNRDYIRDRIALATRKPLNYNRLKQALELLKLDPLIQDIRVNWSEGTGPGQSLLDVEVVEAKTFGVRALLDNGRSPSVGSVRRQLQVTQANLTGIGDRFNFTYTNTEGSNAGDISYVLPLNRRNGTVSLNAGLARNNIIEKPFNVLDIEANSHYYEFAWRQPVSQTPRREFAVGVTFGHRDSEATLLNGRFPFPAIGADDDGHTRITAIRFVQEGLWRGDREAVAVRSQFSIGLGWLNATVNEDGPDSRFLSWLGQAQWLRQLAPDMLMLLRADLQFSDRNLVPIEQFGIGGLNSVRGYRQDSLLADNGIFTTAELRFPIAKIDTNILLQLTPFVDFGIGWNSSGSFAVDNNALASLGLGLRLTAGDKLSARLDWGIPLVSTSGDKRTWQENGLYFSVVYNPF